MTHKNISHLHVSTLSVFRSWPRLFFVYQNKRMPILLDLFSGSLSWSKVFVELSGWECISVDNDAKFTDTTIVCAVLEWEVPERLHGACDL